MSVRAEAAPAGALRARARLTARAGVLAVLVVTVGLFSIAPVREYLDQRERIARLEQGAIELEAANGELREQIVKLRQPEYLERLARECLGMVRPGEIAFTVVPGDGEPHPSPC